MTPQARRRLAVAGGVVFAALAFFLFRARPIAAAPPHERVAPELTAVPALSMCWAEFARNEAWGQVATAGVTHVPTWDVTVSGLVVRHPRGDVVIDVGNSSHFGDEIAEYGTYDHFFLKNLPGSNRTVQTAPDALRARGVDPAAMFGIILSHAHVDHAGGVVDLPGVPIYAAAEERAFIEGTPWCGARNTSFPRRHARCRGACTTSSSRSALTRPSTRASISSATDRSWW